MKQFHIQVGHLGPHSLRHACATRLLNTGPSLQDIADFLGHSDTKTVSIYVKLDLRSLSKVAAFSLAWTR
jgi:site-specific recombinase XerD